MLRRRSALIVVRDLDEAVALAEEVAPEHLELMVKRPGATRAAPAHRRRDLRRVRTRPLRSATIWPGPNHVLPTGGTARFFSPLGVYDFVKRTSVVSADARALAALAPAIETLAALEGYEAHAAAVRMRVARQR